MVSDDAVGLPEAIAFLDERLDHPAWRSLKNAPPKTVNKIRETYAARTTGEAIENRVKDHVAQNFVYGCKGC
jgi:hypothetical protein